MIDGLGRWLMSEVNLGNLSLSPVCRHEVVLTRRTHQMKARPGPLKEGPCNAVTSIYNRGSPTSPKDLSCTRVNVHYRTKEYPDLLRDVRYRSELTVIQGNPNATMAH